MNYRPILVLALVVSVLVTGCAEEDLTSGLAENPAIENATVNDVAQNYISGDHATPRILFQGTQVLSKKGPPSSSADFTSPLFGLASAPNGDILVADAGAGVANVDGGTEIALAFVTDIAPIGRSTMWATTAGEDPVLDSGQGLYRVSQGQNRLIANLFAFEEANDPDGMGVDSNPFDVESLGGRTALVADAGANTLLRVDNQGHIEVVAIFPNELVSTDNFNVLACGSPGCAIPAPEIPAQAVPTSIAVGPDGAMYVGELKGFPAPTDASNIWRIEPGTTGADCETSPACTKVFDGGFTSVIDLAFGPDGRLYVSELDEASWAAVEIFGVVTGGTVNACDLDTLVCEEIATGVPIHTAIAFDRSGTLWAIRNALVPGSAEVVPNP